VAERRGEGGDEGPESWLATLSDCGCVVWILIPMWLIRRFRSVENADNIVVCLAAVVSVDSRSTTRTQP